MKNSIHILSDTVSQRPFEARHGLYAAAGGITFEAFPESVSEDTVDLRVTLRPSHLPAAPDEQAGTADAELAARCVSLLAATAKTRKGERMAAAQQLGTLRWTEAEGALKNAASQDPDADVKIIAARALALLEAGRVAASDLANLQITVQTDFSGSRAGRTDASGRTRLAGIPARAECRLAVSPVGLRLRILGPGDKPQIPLPEAGAAKAAPVAAGAAGMAPAYAEGEPPKPVQYEKVAVDGSELWIQLDPTSEGGAELRFTTMEAKLEGREIRYRMGESTGRVFLRKQPGVRIYEAWGDVAGRFEDLKDQSPEIEVLPEGESDGE